MGRVSQKRYKNKWSMKSKIRIFFMSIILSLFLLLFLSNTFSRFETKTKSKAEMEIAFYCIKEEFSNKTIDLSMLEPREEEYIYDLNIYNYDKEHESKRAETNIEYELEIITTTNIPLEYEVLYAGRNVKKDDEYTWSIAEKMELVLDKDQDGTYFRKVSIPKKEFSFKKDEFDKYRIKIKFSPEYKEYTYQDLIELLEIRVNSKQKI